MSLNSCSAPAKSFALILARTAVRSGPSVDEISSTAKEGVGSRAEVNARPEISIRVRRTESLVMPISWIFCLDLGNRGEGVGIAVLDECARAGKGEMRATDHHLVGDHLVDELAAGD